MRQEDTRSKDSIARNTARKAARDVGNKADKTYVDVRFKMYPKTVLFGDSISDQNGDVNVSGYRWLTSSGYFTWANILSGGCMDLIHNAGISGDTTTAMLARIDTDVLTYNPDMVIVFGGTNDIALAYTSATTISNLRQIYDTLLAKNIKIVICTVLPRTEFDTASEKQNLWEVNNFIKDYAQQHSNVILCDWYSTIVDADGYSVRANMTKDGTHPTILGAFRMGKKLASVLGFSSSKIISRSPDDKRNLLTNGCLSGDSSGKATGWSMTSSATVTASKATVDDGTDYYNQQVLTCTDDTVQIDFYQTASGAFTAGDVVQGIAEVKLSDVTSLKVLDVAVYYNDGTQKSLGRALSNISGYGTDIPVFEGGVLKTPKVVVPAGTTSLRLFVSVKMIGSIKLSNLTLYNFGQ